MNKSEKKKKIYKTKKSKKENSVPLYLSGVLKSIQVKEKSDLYFSQKNFSILSERSYKLQQINKIDQLIKVNESRMLHYLWSADLSKSFSHCVNIYFWRSIIFDHFFSQYILIDFGRWCYCTLLILWFVNFKEMTWEVLFLWIAVREIRNIHMAWTELSP